MSPDHILSSIKDEMKKLVKSKKIITNINTGQKLILEKKKGEYNNWRWYKKIQPNEYLTINSQKKV